MSEVIDQEAIEAAARAIYESESYQNKWDFPMAEIDREEYLKHARAALVAAAPHMLPAITNTREDLLAILENEGNYNYPDWAPEVDLEEMTNALAAYVQRVKAAEYDRGFDDGERAASESQDLP